MIIKIIVQCVDFTVIKSADKVILQFNKNLYKQKITFSEEYEIHTFTRIDGDADNAECIRIE